MEPPLAYQGYKNTANDALQVSELDNFWEWRALLLEVKPSTLKNYPNKWSPLLKLVMMMSDVYLNTMNRNHAHHGTVYHSVLIYMHHIGRQSHRPTQLNILYRYSNGNCSCCSTWEILVDIYPPGDQSFELYCRIVSFSGRNFKYYWFVSFDRSPSRYHSPPGSDAPDFHFSIQRHVASVPTVSLDCYYSVSKSNSHNKM